MENNIKVVVIGGGFGGREAAKVLSKDPSLHITLLDYKNYHLFTPLLYQVATSALSPADISNPIRSLFSKEKNVTVLMEKALSVDVKKQTVITDISEIPYDYLVMACGSKHFYFGHEEWEERAPGLKTIEQAVEIRSRILTSFEKAELEEDEEKRKRFLNFVIVGGGPTGVELAGAIAEIGRTVLEKDFRRCDTSKLKVIVVEALPRILPSFDEKLAQRALRDLKELGVEVKISSRVTHIDEKGVQIGNERIEAELVIWAAGVKADEIGQTLGVEMDKNGRIFVEPDLSLKEYPHVFVIGDQAHYKDSKGDPLPGLAQVALQEGHFVGEIILNEMQGKPRTPFKFRDKGSAATIGKKRAIVAFGKMKITGLLAWFLWLLIHMWYLTGLENRLLVMIKWASAYLWHKEGARIITNADWRFYNKS